MQENLKKNKRVTALKIFVTFAMVLVFCASLVLAICAPCFFSNGVASADSSYGSVGSVNYNLFTNPKFDKQGPNVFDFQKKFAQDVVYADGTTLTYVSSNGGFVVSTTTAVGPNHWVGFLFKPSSVGTYTFTINSDIVGNAGYKFRLRDTSYYTYVDSDSANFSNYISITYNITDLSKDYFLQFLMPSADVSASIYWLKIESGSTFTGYVPNFQDTIEDLQNEVDSQKDTVANYNFSSRFVTPINTPSRQVYFNLNRYPVVPAKKYFKSPSSANWYYMNYFYEYDIEGGQFGGNYATNLGWEVYYNAGSDTTFYKAVLKCNGTAIFQYDCTGSSFDTIVYSNPTWLVASNMQFNGISIYCFDFNGSSHYYTLPDNSTLLEEQFSNSCWAYSFALQDLTNWKDLSYDVYYNNGYNNGFSAGEDIGFSSGKDSGYKEGFSAGKENGYDLGYSDGVASGQDYSFSALFGAVFDVPIQAFKGLFNFEIFGVNMTSFVSSLLALCVIVVIVKICLGGK